MGELPNEYVESIKKEYPKFFERLEILGKSFYGEDFIDIFFLKPHEDLFGFIINKDGEEKYAHISNLGLKACNKFALDQFFEIKD